ncbi:MAG TPA: hypothetical protein VMK16_01230 [Acidimicrobiales bacterium]|nr:hypothetical protein [Acidimicrobiales bacterium]
MNIIAFSYQGRTRAEAEKHPAVELAVHLEVQQAVLIDRPEVRDGSRERARQPNARRSAGVEKDFDPVEAPTHPFGAVEPHARSRDEIEVVTVAGGGVDLVSAAVEQECALMDRHPGFTRLHVRHGMRPLVV